MTYYYIKPYVEPEKHCLNMFGATEVFEEMQQTFYTLALLAESSDDVNPAFADALEQMTIYYD